MNNLLELKGRFNHYKNPVGRGAISLPVGANERPVTIEHLDKLKSQLQKIYNKWENDTIINGALVTVYCIDVIAKSNRLKRLLSEPSGQNDDDNIRGAKFNNSLEKTKHVFTYFVSLNALQRSIRELELTKLVVEKNYGNKINKIDVDNIKEKNINFPSDLGISNFCQIIKDAYFVEDFDVFIETEQVENTSIISLYKTGVDTKELLRYLGINLIENKMLDATTLRLSKEEIDILLTKAPYLIAMKTKDLADLTNDDIIQNNRAKQENFITEPQNEPVIGVIDTLFDETVYFANWVEFVDMIDDEIPKNLEDRFHGTAVSSIIVDGPALNPNLNDGCGRFKVKHFGVATAGKFSSFSILKSIRIAVKQNPQIKVWNLSLGSMFEINPNFISPEAAELDKIQSEYDVVFVVSGTNKPKTKTDNMKIGAPADSINSIVVNSVDFKNQAASYHRTGPVLSFFYKPDVSYYGGDKLDGINVYSIYGETLQTGTSFAAPWITRKMAYLIQILGFSREVAKALIIDSAAGWNRKDSNLCDIGYGIVPIRIEDIVSSRDDEIKFVFSGATEQYETSAFNIPIPVDKDNKYPFITRATLCYYPKCSRNQGVDYTDTEINFQFGRVTKSSTGGFKLNTFDKNTQGEICDKTKENSAREHWRKWDNIKHIAAFGKQSTQAKKSYDGAICGVKMTIKERLTSKHETIPFGIVITLKEINGVNRISDFIKNCNLKGWLVNQVDIKNRIEINNVAEEEIIFD